MACEIEKEGIYKNIKYVCVFIYDMGHRCGYVGFPKDSIFYGIQYNENISEKFNISRKKFNNTELGKKSILSIFFSKSGSIELQQLIDVHGSITYSSGNKEYPIKSDLWFFGFDCAHSGDGKDLKKASNVIKEIELKYPTNGIIRDLEYVENECKYMIDNFINLEKYINKRLK